MMLWNFTAVRSYPCFCFSRARKSQRLHLEISIERSSPTPGLADVEALMYPGHKWVLSGEDRRWHRLLTGAQGRGTISDSDSEMTAGRTDHRCPTQQILTGNPQVSEINFFLLLCVLVWVWESVYKQGYPSDYFSWRHTPCSLRSLLITFMLSWLLITGVSSVVKTLPAYICFAYWLGFQGMFVREGENKRLTVLCWHCGAVWKWEQSRSDVVIPPFMGKKAMSQHEWV